MTPQKFYAKRVAMNHGAPAGDPRIWPPGELCVLAAESGHVIQDQAARIAELAGLLRSLTCSYRAVVQSGYDRITALGGDCDSVAKMLADFPEYALAVAAIAVDGQCLRTLDPLTFHFRHRSTNELRSVCVTRAEVAEDMADTLFEKLVSQFCECEPVGETNEVECRCDEYGDEFELVADVDSDRSAESAL